MHLANPKLFAARGCPFGQRVLALLDHLGVAREHVTAPVGEKPDGLLQYSESGRLPLLAHGGVVLGESRVMLEHLAEAYGFAAAYPGDLERRTLHRHAMAVMDGPIVSQLTRNDPPDGRLSEYLDVFERAAVDPPEASLVTFHLAPMWLRFQWWRPESAVTQAIRARRTLADWLDGAAALRSVVRTSPDAAENTADFKRVALNRKASP